MRCLLNTFLLLLILSGCKNRGKQADFPDAGVLTYSIKYPSEIANAPTGSLMPGEMKLIFRQQKQKITLNGSFNIFSLNFISHSPSDSCTTIFRFIDSNHISKTPNDKNIFLFGKNDKPEITFEKNETKVINGFNCNKALVTYKDKDPFSVYYTNEIALEEPNRNSSLSEIEGVLMEFYLDYNGVRFHFKANNFDYKRPKQSEFKIPKNVKQSSPKEIEALIITLINNFQ